MARLTREEKTIEHSEIIVEDLKKLYTEDAEAYKEYKKLFEEYKKISKRFNRTVNISDAVGKNVIEDNEQLKDNIEYTVKLAKKKIFYNIEEHRKTKETLAKHSESDKEIIQSLKRELRDLRKYTSKLESELNNGNEVNHQFHELAEPIIRSSEINAEVYKNLSYEIVLKNEIENTKKANHTFTVAKLTIDEFSTKKKMLNQISSDTKTLITILYKFFVTSIGSKNIVYYFADNIFYLIFPNMTKEESNDILTKINIPRKLSNIIFTFSIGATQYDNETDDFNSLNQKCNLANGIALKNNTENSIEFK